MKRFVVPLLALSFFASSVLAGEIKLACVGDSITFGLGIPRGWDYPAQLQRMLGTGPYTVRNFGVNGATLLRDGDRPYEKQAAFKAALDWKPDIVIIMLGANDSKPVNWGPHSAEFDTDYRWLVSQFPPDDGNPPTIYLCRPCLVSGTGRYGITDPVIQQQIPIIDKIAADLHLKEIDMHAALQDHPEDLRDTVHPNTAGATLLAKAAYKAVIGDDFQGQVPVPASPPAPAPAASP
jgi:lysophospholipase L1-like esterase